MIKTKSSEQVDNPNICIFCGCDLTKKDLIFGAGTGGGQKFQCAECYEDKRTW